MDATRTDILSSIFCKLIQRLIGVVHNASSRLSVHACSTQGRLRVGLQNSESKWRVFSRPSAFPCCSQSSSLCKEKQSSRVTRFVLHTRGVYASRNWQTLDWGALLLEQRFERTKPESVTERPQIHARRRATTLMSRVQTRRDETKRKPVQKFSTAVAIQRQKFRDQKKWTDAQNTSDRYRKEQGNTGKKKRKNETSKRSRHSRTTSFFWSCSSPRETTTAAGTTETDVLFPSRKPAASNQQICRKKEKEKQKKYHSTKVRSVPHGLQAFFLAR